MRPCQRCGGVYWFRDHETANGRLARCARCDFVAIEALVRDDAVSPSTTTSDSRLERLVRVMLPLALRVEGQEVTVPTGLMNVARALEEELDGFAPLAPRATSSPEVAPSPEVLNGDRISMGMGRFQELLTLALHRRGFRTFGDPKQACDWLINTMESDFDEGARLP